MHLSSDRPRKGIISIVTKLLEGEALEEGEEFEYIPVESEAEGAVGPHFSTPQKGDDPVIPHLVKHFKSLQTSELKQLWTAFIGKWMLGMYPRISHLSLMLLDPTIRMSLLFCIV